MHKVRCGLGEICRNMPTLLDDLMAAGLGSSGTSEGVVVLSKTSGCGREQKGWKWKWQRQQAPRAATPIRKDDTLLPYSLSCTTRARPLWNHSTPPTPPPTRRLQRDTGAEGVELVDGAEDPLAPMLWTADVSQRRATPDGLLREVAGGRGWWWRRGEEDGRTPLLRMTLPAAGMANLGMRDVAVGYLRAKACCA